MMLVRTTTRFRKALRGLLHSGRFDRGGLGVVIDILASGGKLDASYRDHQLTGEFVGYRECHIRPDLLLIYRIENNNLILVLVDLGSHSELFG